jgi:hypothetical protein
MCGAYPLQYFHEYTRNEINVTLLFFGISELVLYHQDSNLAISSSPVKNNNVRF